MKEIEEYEEINHDWGVRIFVMKGEVYANVYADINFNLKDSPEFIILKNVKKIVGIKGL